MVSMKRNKMVSFCGCAFLVLAMILSCCISTFAAEDTGSIRLVCKGKQNEQVVYLAGDTYALVQVAHGQVDHANGTIHYTTCEDYAEYDCDWASLSASQSRDKAKELAEVATRRGEYDVTGVTDAQGVVVFDGLSAGLYLLLRIDVNAANADFLFDPCFLRMPEMVNGEAFNDVTVSPKYVWDEPDTPPDLPQTGQTNWPIPVMMVSGIMLYLAGMEMWFGRRRKNAR